MKNTTISTRVLGAALITGVLFGAGRWGGLAATQEDLESRISSASILYRPLVRLGSAPSSLSENEALWAVIEKIQKRGVRPYLAELEEFLTANPTSAWAPSLHANLGRYCEERGRYSRALEHWEGAWTRLRAEKDGTGKASGDFAPWRIGRGSWRAWAEWSGCSPC